MHLVGFIIRTSCSIYWRK